jgi:hypothetical protein
MRAIFAAFLFTSSLLLTSQAVSAIICKAKDYSDCRTAGWGQFTYLDAGNSDTDAAAKSCYPNPAIQYHVIRTIEAPHGSAELIEVTCKGNTSDPLYACIGSYQDCDYRYNRWAMDHKAYRLTCVPAVRAPSLGMAGQQFCIVNWDQGYADQICIPNRVTRFETIPMPGGFKYIKAYCDNKYYRISFDIGEKDKGPIPHYGCAWLDRQVEIAAMLCGGQGKVHHLARIRQIDGPIAAETGPIARL